MIKSLDVCVPCGVDSEDALLTVLADGLKFPGYFGGNWNAFEECLLDLAWLPEGDIAIVHKDVPLRNNLPGLQIYLSILNDAVEKWAATQLRSLHVVFRGCDEAFIGGIIR